MSAVRSRLAAEDVAWLGAIAAALCLVVAFAWITPQLAKLYPSPHETVFHVWSGFIKPEPLEDVRAILTLATPFVVAGAVLLLGSRGAVRHSLDPWIVGAQVVGVLLVALGGRPSAAHLQLHPGRLLRAPAASRCRWSSPVS